MFLCVCGDNDVNMHIFSYIEVINANYNNWCGSYGKESNDHGKDFEIR